jgi:hypothetical protein
MRSFDRVVLAAAIAALVGTQPAFADAPGLVAELKQVHIELIDLDPTDGITPWVQFPADPVNVLGLANPSFWPDGFWHQRAPLGTALTGTATASLPSNFVHLEVGAGDINLAGAGPTLSASGYFSPGGDVFGVAGISGVLTVSAKTRVVLSGQPGRVQIDLDPASFGAAMAYASVHFCPLTPGDRVDSCFDETTQTDLYDMSLAGEHRSPTFTVSEHPSVVTVTWDNQSLTPQDRVFGATALVQVSSVSAPVPEPSAALMLILGLGCGSYAVKRRRQPARSA